MKLSISGHERIFWGLSSHSEECWRRDCWQWTSSHHVQPIVRGRKSPRDSFSWWYCVSCSSSANADLFRFVTSEFAWGPTEFFLEAQKEELKNGMECLSSSLCPWYSLAQLDWQVLHCFFFDFSLGCTFCYFSMPLCWFGYEWSNVRKSTTQFNLDLINISAPH
jgi:hypothetical protein